MKTSSQYIFALLTLALLFTGCMAPQSVVTYDVGLDQVERPADAEDRYGDYTVTQQEEEDETAAYVYEDEMLRATWLYTGSLVFQVENKTDHSLRILLEEGAFVMPSGSSDRILTGNMSYAERNDAPSHIIVPRQASAEAVLIPSSNISFSQYTGVGVSGIISPGSIEDEREITGVQDAIGKRFSILLPVQIQETVNDYTFTFHVRGARIEGGADIEERSFGSMK